jgi:hypothetical protein
MYRMQSIFLVDFANVICAAGLEKSGSKKAFNVSCALPLTFNKLIEAVAEFLGRSSRKRPAISSNCVWFEFIRKNANPAVNQG